MSYARQYPRDYLARIQDEETALIVMTEFYNYSFFQPNQERDSGW
jgi:hypothetical protein